MIKELLSNEVIFYDVVAFFSAVVLILVAWFIHFDITIRKLYLKKSLILTVILGYISPQLFELNKLSLIIHIVFLFVIDYVVLLIIDFMSGDYKDVDYREDADLNRIMNTVSQLDSKGRSDIYERAVNNLLHQNINRVGKD